jgi:cytochrome P450
MINVPLAHSAQKCFPDADSFNPDRFIGATQKPAGWIPYGGGFQRCIGAAYANMAMDTTLRTLLHEFRLEPTRAPGERPRDHGVIFAPDRGALAIVHRRKLADPGGSAGQFVDVGPQKALR